MALFESIEGELSAFFLSQGTMFESIVKNLMDRIAQLELRVESYNASYSAHFDQLAATIAQVEAYAVEGIAAATQVARDAEALARENRVLTDKQLEALNETLMVQQQQHGAQALLRSEQDARASTELEYFVMSLSRQLNYVLELFFRPYSHEAVNSIQTRQGQFQSVSDVLTANEAILMHLAQQTLHVHEEVMVRRKESTRVRNESLRALDKLQRSSSETQRASEAREGQSTMEGSEDDGRSRRETSTTNSTDGSHDVTESAATETEKDEDEDSIATPRAGAFGEEDEEDEEQDEQSSTLKVSTRKSRRRTNKAANDDEVDSDNQFHKIGSSRRVLGSSKRGASRKRSLFATFQEMHETVEDRAREQAEHDEELLLRVQAMLEELHRRIESESKALVPEALQELHQHQFVFNNHVEAPNAEVSSTAAHELSEGQEQQVLILLQRERDELRQTQLQWLEQQLQQPMELINSQLQEVKNFESHFTINGDTVATHDTQIQRLLEVVNMLQQEAVRREELAVITANLLQAARDDCVHGVSAEALEALKQEVLVFQTQLQAQAAEKEHSRDNTESEQDKASDITPTMAILIEEVNQMLDLLTRILAMLAEDRNSLHSGEGAQMMQTLRTLMSVLEELVLEERDANPASNTNTVILDTLRQMERGTASLLDAFEQQQEQTDQLFAKHQAALEKLSKQAIEQKYAEMELKKRLAACPSQEDTLRVMDELRTQIHLASVDSTTRVMDTVDELRHKLVSLPTNEVIDNIARALKSKVDRSEMERKLLDAVAHSSNNGSGGDHSGPVGSMMKSPLRCLSCDQTLPMGHSPDHAGDTGGLHPHMHPHHHGSPFSQLVANALHASPEDAALTKEELLAALSPTRERRKKHRQHVQQQLHLHLPPDPARSPLVSPGKSEPPAPDAANDLDWKTINIQRAFVNLDETRNRIPLRRPSLSDQVIYGPAITPNLVRNKPGSRLRAARNTTATPTRATASVQADRSGEIITRSSTSSVVIGPFAEQQAREAAERKERREHSGACQPLHAAAHAKSGDRRAPSSERAALSRTAESIEAARDLVSLLPVMKNRWVEAMKRGAMVRASPRGRIPTPSQDEEVDEFIHNDERCRSIGECTVATVLDNCMLQGGVHHTHMNVLTYLGNPLRTDWCCYPIRVQWFRAIGDRDDFQAIPFANHEWFTPTADDIGARILAKVTVQDEDVAKTKMLEYGPIKEDPEVRSKVEMYLERKSVLFMGLRSLRAQDGAEYADNEELCESWTLLIDDKRVRLTCESSLLPPFEGLYTNDIRVEIVRETPNELRLYLPSATFVHLRAESNIVRDIIVLTLRAFCKEAVGSEAISDAVSKGISPMLTIRTLSLNERTLLTRPLQSPKAYDLPWYRPNCSPRTLANETTQSTSAEPHDSTGSEISDIVHIASRSPSPATRDDDDDVNDSLLLDVEALIGNALKMGIQNQILPPVRKRISIAEIPDLQIVGKPVSPVCRRQQSGTAEMEASPLRERRLSSDCSTEVDGDTDGVADAQQPELGPSEVEEAIQSFQRQASGDPKADAMRDEYVAIFYALQSDLRQYKERTMQLTRRLEERDEQNAAFRQDIDVLRTALASMQIAEQSQIAEQCKVLLGELPALMEGAPGNTNDTPSGSPVRLPSNQHTRSLSTPQKRQKS